MPQIDRIEIRDEYRYEPIGYFSCDLSYEAHAAARELRLLRERFDQPPMHQAVDDARPLLDELAKIVDALDESNGTDPQSMADPEADELFEEQEHYEDGMGSSGDSGVS